MFMPGHGTSRLRRSARRRSDPQRHAFVRDAGTERKQVGRLVNQRVERQVAFADECDELRQEVGVCAPQPMHGQLTLHHEASVDLRGTGDVAQHHRRSRYRERQRGAAVGRATCVDERDPEVGEPARGESPTDDRLARRELSDANRMCTPVLHERCDEARERTLADDDSSAIGLDRCAYDGGVRKEADVGQRRQPMRVLGRREGAQQGSRSVRTQTNDEPGWHLSMIHEPEVGDAALARERMCPAAGQTRAAREQSGQKRLASEELASIGDTFALRDDRTESRDAPTVGQRPCRELDGDVLGCQR